MSFMLFIFDFSLDSKIENYVEFKEIIAYLARSLNLE